MNKAFKELSMADIAIDNNGIVDGPFGSNLKKSDYIDDSQNGIPVLTTKNLYGDYSSDSVRYISKEKYETLKRSTVFPGDIIVAKIGSIGKCGIYPLDQGLALIPANLLKITVRAEISRKYVFYYIQSRRFQDMIKSISTATAQPAFNVTKFRKLPIPVPPLEDQHRIVIRIEELFSQLDSGVETLKKTKEQLKVYRQAVLKEAFEGAFTQHLPIEEDLEWYEGDIINLPPIPQKWRYIYLSKLGELARGKSKHRPRNDAKLFENGKYPFLQTGDIKSANKYVTVYEKMYGDFGLNQSKLWKKGTLCITIAANIAETAFLGLDACFPDSIVGFTANETVLMEYVRYFIEASKIRLWAFAPATAQKNINLKTLENLVIPYCCINEQKKVVEEIESRLSVCDSIEKTIDTALQEAEALRQSILKQAFEGGL